MRLCLIADVHGRLDAFAHALAVCGVTDLDRPVIDAGWQVVQVGDLVHKGPDSDRCVQLADRLLTHNPGRYVQLWGNHDCHYVGGPDVSARDGVIAVSQPARDILARWDRSARARLAVAAQDPGGRQVLITHGGLTAGCWQTLGRPACAKETARALNRTVADPAVAFRPGALMTGTVDEAAGVICPRTGSELAASWLNSADPMPFDQIHGHESVIWWPDRAYHTDVPAHVRAHSRVDWRRRQAWVEINGRCLWSIDPRLDDNDAPAVIGPVVLDGVTLI